MPNVTVDRRLYLTADRKSLVEEGDTSAASLWAGAGRVVTQAEADEVGYEPRPSADPEVDPFPEAEISLPEPEPDTEPEPADVKRIVEPEVKRKFRTKKAGR